MEKPPIIDVHSHIEPRQISDSKIENVDSNKIRDIFSHIQEVPLYSNVEMLIEALNLAESKLKRQYYSCVFPIDSGLGTSGMAGVMISKLNDFTAESISKDKKKRLIGFASIDPRRGGEGLIELERCIREKGLRGVKFHPSIGYYPDDEKIYPFYEKVVELQKELNVTIPLLFHTGVAPSGSKYCRPVYLDMVATNFEPKIKIIAAHAGVPWIDEMIWVAAVHPKSIFIDICAVGDLVSVPYVWPEYYAQFLGKAIRGVGNLVDRLLFASDWPFPWIKSDDPKKPHLWLHNWVNEFKQIKTPRILKELGYPEITDEIKEKILCENAKAIIELPNR